MALTTTHPGGLTNITNCNNDWATWNVGSRTQYNFTPAMYVGLDVIYSKLETASAGGTAFYTATANTAKPSTTYQLTDEGNWAFRAASTATSFPDARDNWTTSIPRRATAGGFLI